MRRAKKRIRNEAQRTILLTPTREIDEHIGDEEQNEKPGGGGVGVSELNKEYSKRLPK